MRDTLPSLQFRFLRIFLGIAWTASILISVGFGAEKYISERDGDTRNMSEAADRISRLLILNSPYSETNKISDYLQFFSDNPHAVQACVYDENNKILSFWQRSKENFCPALMTKEGIETDAQVVHVAFAMKKSGQYFGMVYVEGELFSWVQGVAYAAKILTALILITSLICWLAARLSAGSIVTLLSALRQQVECLKASDIMTCTLPPKSTTAETAALSTSISSLRRHFDETTVSKEAIANVRSWHSEVLSGFLSSLRHCLQDNSPAIEALNDYALLLQTLRGDILPPVQPLDLATILDQALLHARGLYPPDANVNVTTSFSSAVQGPWEGRVEIIETLLRHLLLIGLKRTRDGFVCLKLEAYLPSPLSPVYTLRISLQDSGPFMQHWQLQQWLVRPRDDIPPINMTGDISWLLTARLFKRLGGTLTGASNKEGGLILEGSIPLMRYIPENDLPKNDLITPATLPTLKKQRIAPLILVIEGDKENHFSTQRLLSEMGCEAFIVSTPMQALEWAPVLPFSAIILNGDLMDAVQDVTRRLRHMAEDGVMPKIPLWASTAKFSFIDVDYWRQQGITEFLLKPFQTDKLQQLVRSLKAKDSNFYLARHLETGDDMMSLALPMSDMNRMLSEQIEQIEPVLQMLLHHEHPVDGRNRPHAVRSAALTMGYFQLAALMAQIEHACVSPRFDMAEMNWKIVSEILKSSGFNRT